MTEVMRACRGSEGGRGHRSKNHYFIGNIFESNTGNGEIKKNEDFLLQLHSMELF
jgi:hypothetical protein